MSQNNGHADQDRYAAAQEGPPRAMLSSPHTSQPPPQPPSSGEMPYDDPTNLLRVYPFATYQPIARGESDLAENVELIDSRYALLTAHKDLPARVVVGGAVSSTRRDVLADRPTHHSRRLGNAHGDGKPSERYAECERSQLYIGVSLALRIPLPH